MKLVSRGRRGQALVEFALVAPLLFLLIGGIITVGIGVFYQQQLTNAAREAARYAAIHSATSQCPTTSRLDPNWSRVGPEIEQNVYYDCDPPDLQWPEMTQHARSMIWGLDRSAVTFSACWSGYWDNPVNGHDAAPLQPDGVTPNEFRPCKITGIDPRANTSSLACPAPMTNSTDDTASDLASSSDGSSANQVTVYACYVWHPPFIADLLGGALTMRAVITEAMQHQQ
jgi:hypothetical protein